jgi:ABC-2 type transport system ATP-binding protein
MALIEAERIVKEFVITKKERGLLGAIKGMFAPRRTLVRAVDDVSFSIGRGEIVGYIGPNGAGKSTTIKILSGILHPTSGSIRINGISPQKDRIAAVRQIGVVFGQKTQLFWDIRLGESFELIKRIYDISEADYRRNLELMDGILGIGELMDVPVRQLSLGQRMKGDLTAALLHSPPVIFLDEPTIGLDIQSKKSVRQFIRDINRERGVTIILTTHDLDDVEELCSRLIVINKGRIVEDGGLDGIVNRLAPYRVLIVDTEDPVAGIDCGAAEILKCEQNRLHIKFDRNRMTASELIALLSGQVRIRDLSVQEPDIEDVVERIYGR